MFHHPDLERTYKSNSICLIYLFSIYAAVMMNEIVRNEPKKKKKCDKTPNERIVVLIKPCLTFVVVICLNSQINYIMYYFFYSPHIIYCM